MGFCAYFHLPNNYLPEILFRLTPKTLMATDQNNFERVEDNYLECSKYAGHATSPTEGFTIFQAEDGLHYFTMVSKSGKVIFRSEGYPTTAARDNGIASVQKNRELRERYSILKTKSGESFVILKAGNHQEIARSCGFGTDADLYTLFPFMAEGYAGGVNFNAFDANSNRNVDEYLDCEAYAGHTTSPEKGFTIFKSEEGEHYFAVVDSKGKVIFRSEGYPTTSARDNGIQSVIKNRGNKDRYKIIQEDGKYYVALRAGNNQEIARSCAFDSEPNIDALYFAPVASANRNVDEYLDCEAYTGHTESPEEGFTIFKSEEGEHYFAVVDKDGKVLFRSEGYPTTGARDNGIQSVIKNRGNKDRYKVIEEDGKYYVALRAGNNQEIARSCAFDSAPNIDALYFAPIIAAAALEADRNIDEYLDCDAYKGHSESPHKDFVTFKQGDFYYFAMLDGDGNVKLRSESYPTTAARDNGLASVIKNKDIKERYKQIEEDGKHYIILRAGNNQEIARSCPQDDAAGLWAMFPYLAPLGALAFGVASASASPKTAPVDDKTDLAPLAAAGAAAAATFAASALGDTEPATPAYGSYNSDDDNEKSGGGFKWWWLLPLLLLPLLWCLFNDCGCSKPKVEGVADSTQLVAPATIAVDSLKKDTTTAVTPAAPAETGCNCDANLHPLFNVNAAPKSLHRLGSNPEYGWSHGLSTKEFYEKLQKRYKANAIDKDHLDGIAKAMGYANGFSDLTADAFTEVKLPKGTVGNLGYSKQHKFGVYALDMDKERDLEAFHIKSKNGCDVHIMKTCGNMMFFCNK